MKTFEQIKTEILALAKQKGACSGGYIPAEKSTNIDELMKVIKDNFAWCYNNELVTIAILDEIGEPKVNEFGIYYKGEVERLKDLKGLYLCGSVKVKYLENSQVLVMWGNSQVSEMWGNSQVSVMRGNSQVSEMWGNSFARSYSSNLPKETHDRYCFVDLQNNKIYIGENLTLAK